jgi:hypothetical protein
MDPPPYERDPLPLLGSLSIEPEKDDGENLKIVVGLDYGTTNSGK